MSERDNLWYARGQGFYAAAAVFGFSLMFTTSSVQTADQLIIAIIPIPLALICMGLGTLCHRQWEKGGDR